MNEEVTALKSKELHQPTAVTEAKREVNPGFSSVNLLYSPALKFMDLVFLKICGDACPVCTLSVQ